MPTLAKVLKDIRSLEPAQREELLLALAGDFPFWFFPPLHLRNRTPRDYPSIVATPNVCGGAARFIRTRIPIWAVERMRQLGVSEIDILRSYPRLRAVDLVEAWSYAENHREEIERAIRANETEEPDRHEDAASAAAMAAFAASLAAFPPKKSEKDN